MADSEPLTYTIPQAAKALNVSVWTIRKWLREGRLPVVPYTGHRVLISRKGLADWVEQKEGAA